MATLPIVNTGDKRKGLAAALIAMGLLFVYLLLVTIEMADPPPPPPIVEAETVFPKELVMENLRVEGAADAGSPNDKEVAPPTPQTEQIITAPDNPDHQVNSGQGSTTTSPNSDNSPANQAQSDDPFASGGSSQGDGAGSTFGQSSGAGTSGNGSGSVKRVRLNDPVINHLRSNEHAIISLILTIDAEGNVISATCNKSATSTTNQILINKVIYEVKKQVKYNKDPGAPLTKVSLEVKVKPK